jgi:hypothetical protein
VEETRSCTGPRVEAQVLALGAAEVVALAWHGRRAVGQAQVRQVPEQALDRDAPLQAGERGAQA